MKLLVTLTLLLIASHAQATSIQCILGTTRCISSQGTEIPSMQALEILDRCDEFTFKNIGRIALQMSYEELSDKSAGRITPLVRAWHAFDDLYDSPLLFERKKNAKNTNYAEIKRSCQQLNSDFNDVTKWSK